jgi:MFS transporter, ACS family, aldohexuronate transporter
MLGVSPLSPSLVHGFALSRLDVAFIVPSIYVGGLLFSVPAGRLADRIGVRPTLLGGLAVGGLALLAAAASPVFPAFLFWLFVAGLGWSVINPALGRAIIDLFGLRERGIAMGLKQMGLTVGGVAAALVLPSVAAMLGWRVAVAMCGAVVALPVVLAWRALGGLGGHAVTTEPGGASPLVETRGWSASRRRTLVVFFGSGLVLGMVQAAVLSYFPLYTIEVLGFDTIRAGFLVAASQAGGAVSRLALGAASDRWMADRRSAWLAGTAVVAAGVFAVYAFGAFRTPLTAGLLAFATGIGAYGWVGIFFVMSAEIGGPKDAGLLSGMAFASIVVGFSQAPPSSACSSSRGTRTWRRGLRSRCWPPWSRRPRCSPAPPSTTRRGDEKAPRE